MPCQKTHPRITPTHKQQPEAKFSTENVTVIKLLIQVSFPYFTRCRYSHEGRDEVEEGDTGVKAGIEQERDECEASQGVEGLYFYG